MKDMKLEKLEKILDLLDIRLEYDCIDDSWFMTHRSVPVQPLMGEDFCPLEKDAVKLVNKKKWAKWWFESLDCLEDELLRKNEKIALVIAGKEKVIDNPFLGCKSYDEARVRADIACLESLK